MKAAVGTGLVAGTGAWTFSGTTPEAFDEHVVRSIPWYAAGHELILDVADQLVPARGRVYDLGCSTGALTRALAERLADRDVEVVGVDPVPGMIRLARRRCRGLANVRLLDAAAEDVHLEAADLVVAYYTLQFLPPRVRRRLVASLAQALAPAGSLLLFEKTLMPTPAHQAVSASALDDWKRRQGFPDDEIAAKARSLRGVLVPQSSEANSAMLVAAGFEPPVPIFRWLAWEGVLATVAA